MNADSKKEEIERVFKDIAETLLFKSYIETASDKFRLLEIEFYFKNENHDDTVTIVRKEEAAMWWLHDWGVDITFKSNGKDCCGGVLVRSMISLSDNTITSGPRNCCWELFYSSALDSSQAPRIVCDSQACKYSGEMGTMKRYITGRTKGIDEEYRYYVKGLNVDWEPIPTPSKK